jgi:hypothetical protein
MKFNIQEINEYVAGSDTDSLFINIGDILNKIHPHLDQNNKDLILPYVKKIQNDIGDKLNNYQSILAKKLLNSDEHYFDLKPEFIIKKAYWSGKRRYAQHVVDQEGIEIDEVVMMGLDIMKSNFPPLFREFGENLIKNILFNKSKQDIDSYIIDFRNSLTNIDWNKLMKPTGLKHLERYTKLSPKVGNIFSTLENKCPMNTKSAIYSNDLIKYYKQENKYHMFQIGDKIYTVYLKDNPYKIDVIALNGHNDCPQILTLAETYIDRSKMFDSVMKEKIEKIYNDLKWSYPVYNKNINKFFKFN